VYNKLNYHLVGPVPIPILGTLIQIGRAASQPHLAFPVLAKEYGDIYSVKLGSHDYGMVNFLNNNLYR
jgi:hypothetical protein